MKYTFIIIFYLTSLFIAAYAGYYFYASKYVSNDCLYMCENKDLVCEVKPKKN